jgi:cytochrome c553
MPTAAALLLLLAADPFAGKIRPVLTEHCAACHNPASPKNKIGFLRAQQPEEMEKDRGTWRKVAAHLRNRTMPPTASKLTDEDRLFIANWVDARLRTTACALGEQAGAVTLRRLNRREYKNTLRDLFSLDYNAEDLFPADEAGGEGFDNNGETLFVPPMLMERYLEAAQQVLDRVVLTPALSRNFGLRELAPQRTIEKDKPLTLAPAEEVNATLQIFNDGDYSVAVWARRPKDREKPMFLKIDDRAPITLNFNKDPQNGPTARAQLFKLARGAHKINVRNGDFPIELLNVKVDQRLPDLTPDRRVVHQRLLRLEPGEQPSNPHSAARHLITRLLPRAFRRPVTTPEIDRYLKLYERSAARGEPFEESVKLALKAILVAPDFLFLIESEPVEKTGLHPLTDHELAARLSYFLWSTMPDEELTALANAGKLREAQTLAAQTNRLLDDPRSRVFAQHFIGQWLNTKEIGGRIAPTISSVSAFYTPEVAVDLREEPILFFHYLLSENKSLLDLLTANYTFMNERLVKFYEYDDKIALTGTRFQKVPWPDQRRAGLLGMGAVLAVSSQIEQTNPVLRGAWLLDTLLGTPAPAPPPDVPALPKTPKGPRGLTMRQRLQQHQADATCASCHKLIDPMGYALENFDWLGRWRDTDNGHPIDASGVLPTGETFNGVIEMRQALLSKKDEFLRRVVGKVMGYALGRSLEDADHCTIQRLMEKLERQNYGTRTLVQEIVLSTPFRYRAPGARKEAEEPRAPSKKPKLDYK